MNYWLLGLLLLFCFQGAFAGTELGQVAQNALIPTQFVTTFLEKICLLVGCGFVLGAIVQFKMHRSAPTAVPFSRCMMLLLLGLALILIPYLKLLFTIS